MKKIQGFNLFTVTCSNPIISKKLQLLRANKTDQSYLTAKEKCATSAQQMGKGLNWESVELGFALGSAIPVWP